MQVVRNVYFDPRMLPGGGATEIAVSTAITKSIDSVEGISKWPYAAVAAALEVPKLPVIYLPCIQQCHPLLFSVEQPLTRELALVTMH